MNIEVAIAWPGPLLPVDLFGDAAETWAQAELRERCLPGIIGLVGTFDLVELPSSEQRPVVRVRKADQLTKRPHLEKAIQRLIDRCAEAVVADAIERLEKGQDFSTHAETE